MKTVRLNLLLPALLVLPFSARAQTFMRAYGMPGATFNPPQSFLSSFGAGMAADGYLFTEVAGRVCFTDAEGAVQECKQIEAASAVGLLQLRQVETAMNGNGYFFLANKTDTMIALRTDAALNIIWQRATVFEGIQLDEQVMPLPDGGCVLGHSRAQGLNQRPVLSRFGPDGSTLWQRTYRNSAALTGNLTFDALARTADNGLLAVGRYNPSTPPRPVLVRLNADGTVLWAKEIAPANNGNAFALAAVELPNGQLRVAVADAATSARLAIVTLSASGDLLSAWGYEGLLGTPHGLRFLPDGTLLGVVVNQGQGFRISSDGNLVFATNHGGLPGSVMLATQLLPTNDGGHLFHGNCTVGFFTDMTPVLYKTGSLGALPPAYGTSFSLTQSAYAPTLTNGTITDSLVSNVHTPDLAFVPTATLNDTLLAVPTGIASAAQPASMQLWPNPVTDALLIDGAFSTGSITITDAMGRVVRKLGPAQLPLSIDTSWLLSGGYAITIATPHGPITKQFIKP
ncbi:MAG TPA: T9SS type A sorting domain-containing protein [Flavobacteriales bacterium]|nr:T9SS type A sorting domain-containing protein [Flavobacteriales bacterium]